MIRIIRAFAFQQRELHKSQPGADSATDVRSIPADNAAAGNAICIAV
jgi:ssRNA-specific RNase YbeY (16S rRNA maturation enzyme)